MNQKITFDTPTRNAIAAKFGVSQQAITNWLARDLRPDINWDVLRQKVSRTLNVYPKSKKSIRENAHVEKHMGKSA